jgi:hypothetical protein
MQRGWRQLLSRGPGGRETGGHAIAAYSEFMPAPRVGRKPYGSIDRLLFRDDDPWGWHVTEYEEELELRPGLQSAAKLVLEGMQHLGRGESFQGITHQKLQDNPYWPADLQRDGAPPHERYVLLTPLALSRTQDDKGRVRWTLFGGSEQGPERAFWRSFFTTPNDERPAEQAVDLLCRLLAAAYGESLPTADDLRRVGFRIYAGQTLADFPCRYAEPLPLWTAQFRWERGHSLRGVKYLLTFQPFARLPAAVRRAYQAGELHLLPFPGSLMFWGTPAYLRLRHELPHAIQLPLLHLFDRHESLYGLRVPQAGWMHEIGPGQHAPEHGHAPVRNHVRRTHRWARVHRHQDELAVEAWDDRVARVLFSTDADAVGLYGKPMARNAQIWTHDYQLILDGPRATPEQLQAARERVAAGGVFGYRFQFPAMRVGRHEVYWHRPLVAYCAPDTGQPCLLPEAPLGYLTAYDAQRPQLDQPIELWPRLLQRASHQAAIEIFDFEHDHGYRRTTINVRKLLDTWELFHRAPLESSFARQLLTTSKHRSIGQWLETLSQRTANAAAGRLLADVITSGVVAPEPDASRRPVALTLHHTARRSFEQVYWNTIAELATGRYVNKDNADCVLDAVTQARLGHSERDLEALGTHLLAYYERTIAAHEMRDKALAGELPFPWRTEFDYPWSGGWMHNQQQAGYERNLLVVIPGRDRHRAVVMADHYDTAYMEDVFGYGHGGGGPRLAAAGADDNHSATAALMLAAPVFLELSRAGKLGCDVWLIHLTGEEFPADCLGARYLCQCLLEGNLQLQLGGGRRRDLSRTRIQGVYVLDMVAHNNDRVRDVFQICPGSSPQSMWLAYQAHLANRTWNELAPAWNRRAGRRGRTRGQRSADGRTIPDVALHPQLQGEVRPPYDPRSTLFNTDGQIFSDAGVPVVLFMENYDINRQGYHDTHDTLENIDLDYGAAVAAIAIESVARAASEPPLRGQH